MFSSVAHNVLQYGVGGVFETRHYPPTQKLKRIRDAGCETNHPAALYCVLPTGLYYNIHSSFLYFSFILSQNPLLQSMATAGCQSSEKS